jgi:1,4-dihydroxy-2-naphthoyl-CoA synthase
VLQVSGSGTTNDIGGSGATINVIPTETIFGSGTTNPVRGYSSKAQTTDGVTYVTIATYQLPINTTADYAVSLLARYSSGTGGAAGDFWRADLTFSADREGGNVTIYPSAPGPTSSRNAGSGSTATAQVITSSSTWSVQVKGAANVTFNWSAIGQEQRLT